MLYNQQGNIKYTFDLIDSVRSYREAYLLFILQPAIALFYAIKNFNAPYSKNIVWLFTIFYGITFAITPDSTSDCVSYSKQLVMMHETEFNISMLISNLYASGSRTFDIYQPFTTFFVSRFTGNYHVLFGVFGVVLGYLYSRNIWYLLDKVNAKLKPVSVLLIVLFAFIVGINSGINGVRFWTATHLFFFGLIRYVFEKKFKFILIAALASLFHFSFLLPTAIMMFYILFGNRIIIYFILFVVSFFIYDIDFGIIRKAVGILPDAFTERTESYIGEGAELKVSAGTFNQQPWYLVYAGMGLHYSIFLIVCYIFLFERKHLPTLYLHLFAAGIFFYGIFNSIGIVPSAGRFLSLAAMLLFSLFFLLAQNYENYKFNRLIFVTSPFLVLFIIVALRRFTSTANYLLFLANPLIAPFIESDTSIWSFIDRVL